MKIIYLTIDDSPSVDMKGKVDFLDSKGIKAIWFCTGKLIEKKISHVIYAIKKGHIIGNHSYNHPKFSRIKLGECKKQIKKTDRLIEEAYNKAKVKRHMKLFRFPELDNGCGSEYEHTNWNNPKVKAIQKYLKDLGYKQPQFRNINYRWWKKSGLNKCINVDCTYDTFDWVLVENGPVLGYKTLKDLLRRMDENVPEGGRGINHQKSNDIVMMHGFINTKKQFIPLIKKMLRKKVKFELPEVK
jgi:peptidoglycan/xylan/chitin deacetylase (PgdA/CDA1 family)